MNKLIYIILGVIIMSQAALSQLLTQNVDYKDGDAALLGYVAYDKSAKSPMPVVIVVHDWMGISDNTKMRCDMLAKLGYLAFAADIYGKGNNPKSNEEAAKLAGMYKGNIPLLRGRVTAALETATKTAGADKSRVAAMGYCFGGSVALELARSGAPVNGVVTFHGGLTTPNKDDAKNIKGKVLVLHGADDPYVKEEDIKGFENEMRQANVDWQLIKYSGAVHAFTIKGAGNDNSKGAAYNEKADKRSWEAMKTFFAEIFAK